MKALTPAEREALWKQTFENQLALIERGNVITPRHRAVLGEFARALLDLATGTITGRWAIGAPPGSGKSTSIAAFIAAAIQLDLLERLPLLVCQRTARALTELQNDIQELLPGRNLSGDVGIYYTTDHPAEAEHCAEPIDRQDVRSTPALLITHSRVLTGEQLREFMEVDGVRRLVVFDESFVRAEGYGIHLPRLQSNIAGALRHLPGNFALAKYLAEADRALDQAAGEAQEDGEAYTDLPELSSEGANVGLAKLREIEGKDGIANDQDFQELVKVLPLQRVRIVRSGKSGTVLQWRARVHPSIEDVLVFDASYPIRRLCHLDESLRNAEEAVIDGRPLIPLNFKLSELIDYRNVRLSWCRKSGGKGKTAWDTLDAKAEDTISARSHHLARVLRRHEGERVAIVTHKDESRRQASSRVRRGHPRQRQLNEVDRRPVKFAETAKADLRALGVDLDEEVAVPDAYLEGTGTPVYGSGKTQPRFTWLTWGSIEGRNDARDCSVIYLAGVMLRDREKDLKPTALGMMDAIDGEVTDETVKELEQSEAAHLIYQAALRGTARESDDGLAKPCTIYVTHWHSAAIASVIRHMRLPRTSCRRERTQDLAGLTRDQRMSEEKRVAVNAMVERLEKLEQEGVDQVAKAELKALAGAPSRKAGKWLDTALAVYAEDHLDRHWVEDLSDGRRQTLVLEASPIALFKVEERGSADSLDSSVLWDF